MMSVSFKGLIMPEVVRNRKRVTVLGAGFTGRRLFADLSGSFEVVLTSRNGNSVATGAPENCLLFDLMRRETWANVFSSDYLIWTFPAAQTTSQIPVALDFAQIIASRQIPALIFASTSCYQTTVADQLVDESFPLDTSQPRVVAEESLRQSGFLVLALAGLYGPARDPADWLRRGLVKNAQQYINLIHVGDVSKVIERWLYLNNKPNGVLADHPLSGMRLNVSDGRHRRWKELEEQLKSYGLLNADFEPFVENAPAKQSKRINNGKLRQVLFDGVYHQYPEQGL